MIRKTARKAIQIAKLIYTPLSFTFIVYFAWANKTLLLKMMLLVDGKLILLSILAWCTLHLISPLLTKITFRLLNLNFSYRWLLGIYVSRLPARYLPGGVWHTVGRLADYHNHGINKKLLTLLALIETVMPALITFVLGGGYLWLSGAFSFAQSIEGLLAMASFFLLLIGPFLLNRIEKELAPRQYIYYSVLTIASVLFWLVASMSFLCYYASLSFNLPVNTIATIAATYIFSWGIGYISIFAPQGIGVFELVAGKLLTLPMNLGGAIAFLAGFRVVALFADCLTWGLYYSLRFCMVRGRSPRNPAPEKT